MIFTSLIYTIISNYFHIESSIINADSNGLENPAIKKSSINSLFLWVQSHYGYANILMGGIIAMLLKIFFRKYKYNIFEITVLLCFVMGEGMLLLALFSLFAGITKIKALFTIMGIATFAYCTWAIGQFYDRGKTSSYFKAFLAYILGNGLFYVLLIIVGLMVDYIRK